MCICMHNFYVNFCYCISSDYIFLLFYLAKLLKSISDATKDKPDDGKLLCCTYTCVMIILSFNEGMVATQVHQYMHVKYSSLK